MPDLAGFAGALGTVEGERTDEYLWLPPCTSGGIKLREGKFEIKLLLDGPTKVTYGGSSSGYKDSWIKWSISAKDKSGSESIQAEKRDIFRRIITQPGSSWVFVRKERALRKFAIVDGVPTEAEASGRVDGEGCQAELTSIRVLAKHEGARPTGRDWSDAETHWSLSFEAFGDDHDRNLDVTANQVLPDYPGLEFCLANSLSYPAWLLTAGQ